jgi:hypothetical protein
MLIAAVAAIAMAAAITASASEPKLNVPYQITSVDTLTNGQFRLQGNVLDASLLGFGAPDVETNDYLVIQAAGSGDIDLYQIKEIWSQAGTWLVCDVEYAESGAPRGGQPEAGKQMISRDGYLYSTTFGIAEYLQTGARNLFYAILADRVGVVETSKVDKAGDTIEWLTVNGTLTAKGPTVLEPGDVQVITNGGQITASSGYVRIQSGGGEVAELATPQISEGSVGQTLIIQGTNNTNVVTLTNGIDLALSEGVPFTMGSNSVMQLVYNGTAWTEIHRNAE